MDIKGKISGELTDIWNTANKRKDGTRAFAEFATRLTPAQATRLLGEDYAKALFAGTAAREVSNDDDDNGVEVSHFFATGKISKKLVPQKHTISFAKDKDDNSPVAVDEQPTIVDVSFPHGHEAVDLTFRVEFDAVNKKLRNLLWDHTNKTVLVGFEPITPALPLRTKTAKAEAA